MTIYQVIRDNRTPKFFINEANAKMIAEMYGDCTIEAFETIDSLEDSK